MSSFFQNDPTNSPIPHPQLYADAVFLEHDTGPGHPERPERLRFSYKYLEDRPVLKQFLHAESPPARREDLQLVHSSRYIDSVIAAAQRGGGRIEADTVISRRSFEVASRAAGAALTAVDAVLTNQTRRALCLIRPPGHHALPNGAMGFCLFNNVALAAQHAIDRYRLDRVLIVDWDVHHGNGTQNTFYTEERVGFLSVHRSPFYPGTGMAEETGSGPALGTKFNLPLRFGISRTEYLTRFESLLTNAAHHIRPDLILISAGFDAHAADPIGSLGLETEDFSPLTNLVCQVANQYCGGKVVSLLEGGYDVQALAECIECHMEGLAKS